jgi:chromosome segregation ATPase
MSDAPERIWFTAVDQNIVPNSCRRTPEDQEYIRADLYEAQAARIAELEERYRLIAGDKINLRGQLASLEGRIADFEADLARKQATIEAAIHEIENRGGDWALSTLKGETP